MTKKAKTKKKAAPRAPSTCSGCASYDAPTSTCRYNPPVYTQHMGGASNLNQSTWSWLWPSVQLTDWCQQWSQT